MKYYLLCHHASGYKKSKLEQFAEDFNPGLALLTDWIISSGNTTLSVDMLVTLLEQMQRDDVVEVIQKGQGEGSFRKVKRKSYRKAAQVRESLNRKVKMTGQREK